MYKYRNNLKLFIFWGVICLLANVVCTASTPYDGDQSFWVGWVQQLIDGGFGGFKKEARVESNCSPLPPSVDKLSSMKWIVMPKSFNSIRVLKRSSFFRHSAFMEDARMRSMLP